MKAITIHGLDDVLADQLSKMARQKGESTNKMVKRLLAEAIGMKPRPAGRHHAEFVAFSGTWTSTDLKDFEQRNADFEKIETEDWK